jgi:putative membrane protein
MRMPAAARERNLHLVLLASLALIFLWSAIRPYDRATWWLEVFPAIIGVFLLAVTYERFRFSRLAYVMVWLHAIVLLVGGHYTYAEVPLFNNAARCGYRSPAIPRRTGGGSRCFHP